MFENLGQDEILRYMGHRTGSAMPELSGDMERLKYVFIQAVTPRHACSRFSIEKTGEGIHIPMAGLTLIGNNICEFMANSCECYLLAATLGIEADRLISLTQKKSISDGLIIDAIANAAIEAYCDELQYKIYGCLAARYSCGYGDLPIELQSDFLSALNAQKAIGLYCSDNNIMIPRKSVTAIIVETSETRTDCLKCNIKSRCIYRPKS